MNDHTVIEVVFVFVLPYLVSPGLLVVLLVIGFAVAVVCVVTLVRLYSPKRLGEAQHDPHPPPPDRGRTMKKWKLGWRLMTPVQKTVFVMLVVCAASALLLPETPYLIRMAGLGRSAPGWSSDLAGASFPIA